MKPQTEIERDYEGISDIELKDQQLEVAVRALHVLAIMHEADSQFMATIAIDALKEMETFGYMYDNLSLDYI
tara:strand:+ start:1169 stop:1384 length:216 start_codon:yes stop_codon:yes gene_type:complete